MNPKIVVFGSLNMDFVVQVERLPAPGETTLGSNFRMIPGGKGANQACALGRLGAGVVRSAMVGRVGYDLFADHLKASLSSAGVDVSAVHATKSAPTGVALIWVDQQGQNSIVVASGANWSISEKDVEALRPVFEGASYALFQLETPLPAVLAALRLARRLGVQTILDPAPAQTLPPELLQQVDFLTPNETEAAILLARQNGRIGRDDAPAVGRELLQQGARSVVLKLGDCGSCYVSEAEHIFVPAFPMNAIDSTAAGDVFNAALAVALGQGKTISESLRWANASAGLSTTKLGAQSSIPMRSDVEAFLSSCAS